MDDDQIAWLHERANARRKIWAKHRKDKMNKDWFLGLVTGLMLPVVAFAGMYMAGQVHFYGVGATGLGRLLCFF